MVADCQGVGDQGGMNIGDRSSRTRGHACCRNRAKIRTSEHPMPIWHLTVTGTLTAAFTAARQSPTSARSATRRSPSSCVGGECSDVRMFRRISSNDQRTTTKRGWSSAMGQRPKGEDAKQVACLAQDAGHMWMLSAVGRGEQAQYLWRVSDHRRLWWRRRIVMSPR